MNIIAFLSLLRPIELLFFHLAGKKEGGKGEGIFDRSICPAKRDWGWEAARPCVSKEAKSAKIDSFLKQIFCARP